MDDDKDGYTVPGDCDDGDDTIHPGAEEICDDIDQDCDPNTDSFGGLRITYYYDLDADGYGDSDNFVEDCTHPPGTVTNDDDCDDSDIAINPDATEVCDRVDNDCDDTVDEGFPTQVWYPDADGDGYGTQAGSYTGCELPGFGDVPGDCNDGNANIYPGAPEFTGDSIDNNCDGTIDEPSNWDVSNWDEGVWGE